MHHRVGMISVTGFGVAVMGLLCGCPAGPGTSTANLSVSFTGLEPLGTGYVYEGWFIIDGQPVSAGRFDVDETGTAQPAQFEFDAADVENATAYVVTIEPDPDEDPGPSQTHVLAGDFVDGTAMLTIGHGAALGNDFASASGVFVLATPTSSDDDTDQDQGIWYLVPGDTPAAGLALPTLPDGWQYEGWIVNEDGPQSTGRFTAVDQADSDGAGAAAGPDGAPPFPGQDYVDPPMSLVETAAVITVEPEPDDSSAPFAFKPLINMSIADDILPATQELDLNLASAPTGTAVVMIE